MTDTPTQQLRQLNLNDQNGHDAQITTTATEETKSQGITLYSEYNTHADRFSLGSILRTKCSIQDQDLASVGKGHCFGNQWACIWVGHEKTDPIRDNRFMAYFSWYGESILIITLSHLCSTTSPLLSHIVLFAITTIVCHIWPPISHQTMTYRDGANISKPSLINSLHTAQTQSMTTMNPMASKESTKKSSTHMVLHTAMTTGPEWSLTT